MIQIVLDIDGVLADNQHRIDLADKSGHPKRGQGADDYWRIALNPDLVAVDPPIQGAADMVNKFNLTFSFGTKISLVYLSSRPESLKRATESWLGNNNFPLSGDVSLICLPSVAQFVNRPIWKAIVLTTLLETKLPQSLEGFFFVDDDTKNREVFMQAAQPWIEQGNCPIATAASLQELQALFEVYGINPYR